MHPLTRILMEDMKPALGVTEPGAVAFATAKAQSFLAGDPLRIRVRMNSGLYKNAFTCGIPHTHQVGAALAAALGAVAGQPDKGLEALSEVTPEQLEKANRLVSEGRVEIRMSQISPVIHLEAEVETLHGCCTVIIHGLHTSVTEVRRNGQILWAAPQAEDSSASSDAPVHAYALEALLDFVATVPAEELRFLQDAWQMNLRLFEAGLESPRTVVLHHLYQCNGGAILSRSPLASARLLAAGAIEARVLGADQPAMSITGSGSHGIIASLPLWAIAKIQDLPEEKLLRSTALSFLITRYIKEHSGTLSSLCGCGIAAGSGTACGAAWLWGADAACLKGVLDNMACSITGMICHGGNHGCVMKAMAAVDAAFHSAEMACQGVVIPWVHGICGTTAGETMRNIGLIADPGMTATEKTIVDILAAKRQTP